MKKLKFWKTAKNKASRKDDGNSSFLDSGTFTEKDFDERRFNGSESLVISQNDRHSLHGKMPRA